jgi:hypothetical protein
MSDSKLAQMGGRAELQGSEPPQPPMGGPAGSSMAPNKAEMQGQEPPKPTQGGPSQQGSGQTPPTAGPGNNKGGTSEPPKAGKGSSNEAKSCDGKMKGFKEKYAKDKKDMDEVDVAFAALAGGEDPDDIAQALAEPDVDEGINDAEMPGQDPPVPPMGGPGDSGEQKTQSLDLKGMSTDEDISGYLEDMAMMKYRNVCGIKVQRTGDDEFTVEGMEGLSKQAATMAISQLGV